MSAYQLSQKPEMPSSVRPIVSIGAGGIVRAAHYPAYKLAGFPVFGVFDARRDSAERLAREFGVTKVFDTLEDAISEAPSETVFDIATPAIELQRILPLLPEGAAVLMQKPMGEDLVQAAAIRQICREKGLTSAVNFQMRYAPYVLAAKSLIDQGAIGELHDIDVRVNVETPWHLWDFLEKAPRMEIVYHSIHYIDMVRSFLGEPEAVYAKTLKHHSAPKLDSSRSAVLLDYGDWKRATITTNHGHRCGPKHQESYIKWEGTEGAIKATMGLNLNYPDGVPDKFEHWTDQDREWIEEKLDGSWIPDAFIGTMASVIRAANGELEQPPTSTEDAYRTMAVVEAAYQSSASGGTEIPT